MWKSLTNNLSEIKDLEQKYKKADNKKEIKIDALQLQTNSEQKIEDANIADEDIIIVEIPKAQEKYSFVPSKSPN